MAPLLMAGLAAGAQLIGSGIGAYKRNQGNQAQNAFYDYAEGLANTRAHLSYLDTAGGKSLLKIADRNYAKTQDAIDNQMAAGGATMENRLAARQANNENRDKMNMQIAQADQKMQDAWNNQLINLKGQRAQFNANRYYQAAQDWNQWGGQMASSLLSLGSTGLLGGAGAVAGAAEAASAGVNPAAIEPAPNYVYGPLAPAVDTGSMGGLRKA